MCILKLLTYIEVGALFYLDAKIQEIGLASTQQAEGGERKGYAGATTSVRGRGQVNASQFPPQPMDGACVFLSLGVHWPSSL